VEYKEFIQAVADRSRLGREEAADLTWATLETLADRLSGGAVRDLALHVPEELRAALPADGRPAKRFGLHEFVERVRERTGLNEREAADGVRAVLETLREAVPGDEYDKAMSQLPAEFR
jgi:uncharacterized protein (DUF2267 family)